MRLVDVAKLNMGQSPPSASYNDIGEGLPFYQGKTDFGFIYPVPRKYCNEPSKIADKGDILISVRAPVGPVNIANDKCCIGRGLAAIKASKADQLFLYFNLIYQESFIESQGTGSTFKAINKSQLENVLIPNIPIPEQRKIAHVLSTVQKAIEQQDNLIRTTTELKKALMQKLFTEGTRGESQKETEIGLVPESWEVVKINEIFDIQQGKQVSKSNRVGNNQKPFLRTINISWGEIDLTELDEMHFSTDEETKFTLIKEDLLVCEGGDVGRTAIWDYCNKEIYYQNHLHRLRAITNNIIPRYLLYWMMYIVQETSYVKDAGNRTTIPNISKSRLGNLYMALPNIQIQKEITETLVGLDRKIIFQNKKKQTLNALFKTLLHELMTGQRRVHELEFEDIQLKTL